MGPHYGQEMWGWVWGMFRSPGLSPYYRQQTLAPGPRSEHPYVITCTRLRPHVAGVGHFSLSVLTRGGAGPSPSRGSAKTRSLGVRGGSPDEAKRRRLCSPSASPSPARGRPSVGRSRTKSEDHVKAKERLCGGANPSVRSPPTKRGSQCESETEKGTEGENMPSTITAASTSADPDPDTPASRPKRLVRWAAIEEGEKRKPIQRTPTGRTRRLI